MQPRITDCYEDGAAGGVCFLTFCAKRDGERVVDLGVNIDDLPGHGFLYASETALVALGHVLGMLTADEVAELRAEVDMLVIQRDQAKAEAAASRAALDAFEGLREVMMQVPG